MAQLATAAVGAAIGFAVGGPIGASIGWTVGSVAGGALFAPTVRTEGPRLSEYRSTTSSYGQMLPVIYGAAPCRAHVIWQAPPRDERNERRVGKNQYQTDYRRFQSFMVALCEGPVQGIKRVWFNSKLVYSGEHDDVVEALAAGSFLEYATFFLGAEDQLPWAVAEASESAAQTARGETQRPVVPGYRGVCCIGFEELDITEWGGIPQIVVEVVENATDTVPSLINQYAMQSQAAAWVDSEYQILTASWIEAPTNQPISTIWTGRKRDLLRDDNALDEFAPPTGTGNVLEKWVNGDPMRAGGPAARDPEGRLLEPFLSPLDDSPTAEFARPYTAPCINDPRFGWQTVIGYLDGVAAGYKIQHALMIRASDPYDEGRTILQLMGDASDNDITSHLVRNGPRLYYIQNGAGVVSTRHIKCISIGTRDTYTTRSEPDEQGNTEDWAAKFELVEGAAFTATYTGITTGADWIGVDEATGDVYVRFAAEDEIRRFDADLSPRLVDPDDPMSAEVSYSLTLQPGSLNATHVWNNQLVTTSSWNPDTDGNLFAQYALGDYGTATLLGTLDVGDTGLGLPVDVGEDEHTPYFVPLENGVFLTNTAQWTMAPRLTAAGRTLADVVRLHCAAVLAEADLDVADVEDVTVRGYLLEQRSTMRAALEPLMQAYGCYAVESNDQLAVRKRGTAPVDTVLYEHLGAERDAGDSSNAPENRSREISTALPARVDVQYMQVEAQYEIGNQIASRQYGGSEQVLSAALPVAMTAAEAARAAWRMLYDAWAQRTSREWSTSLEYIAIEPGDVIYAERADGTASRERVVRKEIDDGILRWESVTDDSGVVVQVSDGVEGPTAPTLTLPSPATQGWVFEAPPLADEDGNGIAVYGVAAAASDRTWPGATWYTSGIDDTDIAAAGDIASQHRVGVALTALPDWSVARNQKIDVRAVLEVALAGAAPDDYSTAQHLAGSGLAFVASPGGGELVRYRTVTATADGFALGGLIRAVLGTDYGSTGHAAGDRVILLPDADAVSRIPRQATLIGALARYRAVTVGANVVEAPSAVHSLAARTLKPLAPAHLHIERKPNGDRVFYWTRRNRAYQDLWLTGTDVPMSEAAESYRVQVLDDAGDTLVDTTAAAASYTFTEAAWSALLGAFPSTIRLRVAQVSAIAGTGAWADETLSDAFYATTPRILHMDGADTSTTVTDTKGLSWTCNGTAKLRTDIVKFGTAALQLPGSSWLQGARQTDFVFGTDDATVDVWFYPTSTSGSQTLAIFTTNSGGASGIAWTVQMVGANLNCGICSGSSAYGVLGADVITANAWHHARMVIASGFVHSFLNGVLQGTPRDISATPINDNGSMVLMLGAWAGSQFFTGRIDEVRFWPGVAVGTANFTPPAAPF